MNDHGEPQQFIDALSRWRESCVFYFKFDLALVAAIAALVSFFKIEGDGLIQAAAQYKTAIYYLVILLIYSLFFEMAITNTSNRNDLAPFLSDAKKRLWMYRVFKWAYELQVLAHVCLLFLSLGFASGYVDGFMECRPNTPGCGT